MALSSYELPTKLTTDLAPIASTPLISYPTIHRLSTMSVTGPQYQVIDTDPTFTRVVRYMRPTDLAIWAGFSAGLPSLLRAWGECCDLCSGRASIRSRNGCRVDDGEGPPYSRAAEPCRWPGKVIREEWTSCVTMSWDFAHRGDRSTSRFIGAFEEGVSLE